MHIKLDVGLFFCFLVSLDARIKTILKKNTLQLLLHTSFAFYQINFVKLVPNREAF